MKKDTCVNKYDEGIFRPLDLYAPYKYRSSGLIDQKTYSKWNNSQKNITYSSVIIQMCMIQQHWYDETIFTCILPGICLLPVCTLS